MSFPALEVLWVARGSRQPEPGTRLPLKPRFTIGRVNDNDLVLTGLDPVARRPVLIERRYDRWWLLQLGSGDETLHNGVPVTNVELTHLDLFTLRNAITLRFLAHDEPDLRNEAFEHSLVAGPDDPARWAVYADWWLEHGAALGERVSRPSAREDGKWLGELAAAWGDGDLQVKWAHGLPSELILRRLNLDGPLSTRPPLEVAARDPMFRFVRHVEIDIEALVGTAGWEPDLAELLEPLTTTKLPLLQRLSVGPLSNVPSHAALSLAQGLELPAIDWLMAARTPVLEVISAPAGVRVSPLPGASLPLTGDVLVGRLDSCALRVEAPEGHPASLLAARLARTEGLGWSIEDLFARTRPYRSLEFALKVNGKEVVHARLRPGDVIELSAGLLVRLGPPAND